MYRREFLKNATCAAGLTACQAINVFGQSRETTPTPAGEPGSQPLDPPHDVRRGDMIYRTLGRTGAEVSAIGLGGHHIGRIESEQESIALIRAAIDAGITFLDNSWDYHEGRSERWMGQALKGGYRDRVFLMTKIDGRSASAAAEQIDESLRRLDTDRIDLMQHHEIIRLHEPDVIFGGDGAQQAMRAAQKAGKIRFVGFTGHKDPLVHLRMLEVAADHGFRFDAVQLPLNLMDAHFRSFEQEVVPRLLRDGVGVLGMKSLGDGMLLESKTVTPQECLRYALSLPTSVVITGIESQDRLNQALEVARTFERLNDQQLAALRAKTEKTAATGKYEQFKTSARFDSTARNPEWLG
jgi:aryl-alcohol dehydrogenase-like predicted oxidoreductase